MSVQTIRAITDKQIDECAAFLKATLPAVGWSITFTEWREKRSLSQNALQHVIYQDISKYLITRGRLDWTPEHVKESLKNKFLGWAQREFVDVATGEKKMREVLRSTATLDKGEACHFTTEIIEWAQSIGCEIKIPDKCEYRDILAEQNL